MEFNLIADPKFRDKIPPLTDDEFKQLEENILEAGEIYEPIVVWNGVIIDGHNRYKIAQAHPEIKWSIRGMDFVDEWAATEWMYKNQLGRRNLTDEQRKYMIGKMYEARKNSKGGDRRSEDFSNAQSGRLKGEKDNKEGTAGEIAKELGVGHNTVRRAEQFAKGVDAGEKVSPGFKEDILTKKVKTTFKDVAYISDMEPEEAAQAVSNIYEYGNARGNRELRKMIKATVNQLVDDGSPSEYSINDLISELLNNGRMASNTLSNSIKQRKELIKTSADKKRVKEAINTISRIIKEVGKDL